MNEKDQVLTEQGVARRRFLKQAGAVAWGAPLIVTMMSRAAYAQDVPPCGTKIGGVGTTECTLDNPCGSLTPECRGLPAGLAGSPCACVAIPDAG